MVKFNQSQLNIIC